jgi:hypothetical protein
MYTYLTQASCDKGQNKPSITRGAHIASAEYTDMPALTAALADMHTVIPTTGLTALDAQVPVAQAAKATGATLFLLGEYGGPTDSLRGLLGTKGMLQDKLREVGPPLLLVYMGPFAGYSWSQRVPFMASFLRG